MRYKELSVGDFFVLKVEAEKGTAFLMKKDQVGSFILIEQFDPGGMSTTVDEKTEVIKIKKIKNLAEAEK